MVSGDLEHCKRLTFQTRKENEVAQVRLDLADLFDLSTQSKIGSIMTSREIPILYSADEIKERVTALAREISLKLPPDLMIVSLLKGSFVFTADLIRALYQIGLHPQIDFMTISSYGAKLESAKTITVNRDLTEEVAGRHVLILDDILESGRTLHFARNLIGERGAASSRIVVLLEKPGKREVPISADFVGFTIPDKFVVGYGLDYANYYRELPYVGVLDIHYFLIAPAPAYWPSR